MSSILGLFILFVTVDVAFTQLPVGSGSFQVISANNKPINVFTYVPTGVAKNSSIIMVMHGAGDDGSGMRNGWITLANQYKFIILSPHFGSQWTGTYQLAGLDTVQQDWEIDVLDKVFDEAKKRHNSTVSSYYFYGMSAGCQFVHRVSTFTSSTKIKAVVCAAAGFYTFPVNDRYYPYGLLYAPVSAKLDRHFCRNTIVIVGGADTARDGGLLQSPEADQQGLTRLARAQNYFNTSQATAKRLNMQFNWRFYVSPGVGHSNGPLATYAAAEFAKWDKSGIIACSTTTTKAPTTTTKPTTKPPTTTKPTTKPPTTTKPLPVNTCAGAIDLVFVIDGSDTMTSARFTTVKSQLAAAVTQSNITWGPNKAHVGIVISTGLMTNGATTPYRQLDLNGCQYYADGCTPTVNSTATLLAAINNMRYSGGKNNIALSMSETLTGEFEGLPDSWYIFGEPYWGSLGDRSNVPNVMIVISGADTSNVAPVRDALLARGIRVYSIGFSDLPTAQLQAISGSAARSFSIAPTNLAATIKNICHL